MVNKQFLNNKCHVVFEVSARLAQGSKLIYLVGDFNNWDELATPMDHKEGDKFTVTLDLDPDREYQYRYLIDSRDWCNDDAAEKYVVNPYTGKNSVVTTYELVRTFA